MNTRLLLRLWIGCLLAPLAGQGQPMAISPLLSNQQRQQIGGDILVAKQDNQGLIWLSTQARCWRFDGQRLSSLNELSQMPALSGTEHLELADSSLWLEQSGELCQFDFRNYTLHRSPQVIRNRLDQRLADITDLTVDPLGRVWVAYWNGLAMRQMGGHWKGGHEFLPEPGTYVAAVAFGPDSSLWVLSENFLSRVVFHSLETLEVGSIQHLTLPEELAHGRADLTNLLVEESPHPSVYLGSSLGVYAFHLDATQGKFVVKQLPPPDRRHSANHWVCYGLTWDQENQVLWVTTDHGVWGWAREPQTWRSTGINRPVRGMSPLRWKNEQRLMMLQGASVWQVDSQHINPSQEVRIVSDIVQVPNQVWRQDSLQEGAWPIRQSAPFLLPQNATQMRLGVWDVVTEGNPLSITYLHAVQGDNRQQIYCTDQGLLWLEKGLNANKPVFQVKKQLPSSQLPSRFPNVAVPSPRESQHLWVGFWRTGREVLIRLNQHTGAYAPFMSFENADWPLDGDVISLRVQTHHEGEELWIGTPQKGLIHALYRPGAKQLYLLQQFDSLTLAGKRWPMKLIGAPEPLDEMHWLLPDAQGWIIWSSATGNAHRLYDYEEGVSLQGQQVYRDQRGQVWLSALGRWYKLIKQNRDYQAHAPRLNGASNGMHLGLWDTPSEIHLMSHQKSWRIPTKWSPDFERVLASPLLTQGRWLTLSDASKPIMHQRGLTYATQWTLPIDCHSLEIAVSLPGSPQPWYWYQLEGFDPMPIRSRLGEIRYTHLPPGQYCLRVMPDYQSSWQEEQTRSLMITVPSSYQYPWWPLGEIGVGGLILAGIGLWGRKRSRSKDAAKVHITPLNRRPAISWNEAFLAELRQKIEARVDDPNMTVQGLAQEMHLSHSQFTRKVKALTQRTPVELIREIRLQHAAHLLQLGRYQICEVAYLSGFSDPDYFRRCFKQVYTVSPRTYQAQQEAVSA